MSHNEQPTQLNQPRAALLFEYVKSSSCSTSSIATEHYAIGYVIHGNCRVHSACRSFDLPEQCLYVLERGKHIIESRPDCNGVFEHIVMHLDKLDQQAESSVDVEDRRLESVVMSAVAENLTLEELAERCFVSVSTFKRHFRRRYSMPPHRWFISRRLDIAYRAVIATDVPITEIAKMCGFPNPSHFISAFKRQYNVTPASLRRSSIHEGAEQVPSE